MSFFNPLFYSNCNFFLPNGHLYKSVHIVYVCINTHTYIYQFPYFSTIHTYEYITKNIHLHTNSLLIWHVYVYVYKIAIYFLFVVSVLREYFSYFFFLLVLPTYIYNYIYTEDCILYSHTRIKT